MYILSSIQYYHENIIVILVNVLVHVGVLAAMRCEALEDQPLQIHVPISHGKSFCSQGQLCSPSVSVQAEPNCMIQSELESVIILKKICDTCRSLRSGYV